MQANEVHARARDVLRFWFEEATRERWFARDDGFDAAIRDRFAALRERVIATDAAGWDAAPDTLLAAIIVIDQFGRNLFRGQARAFAADPVARRLTRAALRNRWDTDMTGDERSFLYLPLEHSEDAADQADSVRLFTEIGDESYRDFAVKHRDVIARFGRFPARNAALGRVSTPAEEAYLREVGDGW